jgi:hypothetical protein
MSDTNDYPLYLYPQLALGAQYSCPRVRQEGNSKYFTGISNSTINKTGMYSHLIVSFSHCAFIKKNMG